MDEHRNEPIGEQQTGAAAATDGAQANAGSPETSSASAHQATPANTPANAGAAKPSEAKPAGKSEIEKSDGVSRPRPGTVTIMAPSPRENLYRHWDDEIEVEAPDEASQSAVHRFGVRKLAAVAAAVILAAIAGAVGGALATASLSHRSDAETTAASAQVKTLDAQVVQLQTELTALKADLDHAAKQSTAQLGKTADRIEKLEKAQAEPAAKIAKLSETVEKLRTAQVQPPAAPAPAPANVAAVPAKDVTGSITPKADAAKPGRLPTVEGWVLRDVYDGGAVVEGRSGTYEVYAGDPIPGVGRVDAIRRQDGRWVVVTSRGLIVAR
ncbi:flagellar hook-length control protein FliK [Rhodopseudomonas palustris]|uniref:hypothetical protein n=1 Tax=Rhodopseudomonas palustris TaxID=1076 RepID=UPI000D1B8583|nr:hypothetical protein [Rhodopseudomonas palustris]AVT75611.1 flagellar hook-length control protein FliK [Rhodopseudomonas palustris]